MDPAEITISVIAILIVVVLALRWGNERRG